MKKDIILAEKPLVGDSLPEKIVQIIWNEQILHFPLATQSGEEIKVIHRGIWNVEPGPDFHNAILIIGEEILRGDIEIHRTPEAWTQHHHEKNSEYQNVILHVVWDNPQNNKTYPEGIPLCTIKTFLAVTLEELLKRADISCYPYAKMVKPDDIASWFAHWGNNRLVELLCSYGEYRLFQKAQKYIEGIERFGIERCAYRGFMESMGYKNNRESFLYISDQLPLEDIASYTENTALAVLFGIGGLLPDPSQVEIHSAYASWVNMLWSSWWSKRKEYHPLHWQRKKGRPYNTPERRLMAAYYVLKQNNFQLGKRIIDILCAADQDPKTGLKSIEELFLCPRSEKIDSFLNFQKVIKKSAALLGIQRIRDITVNFSVPFFLAYCLLEGQVQRIEQAKTIFRRIPRLQDNRLLKEAAHIFLIPPSRGKEVLKSACAQQGLLCLYREYIDGYA